MDRLRIAFATAVCAASVDVGLSLTVPDVPKGLAPADRLLSVVLASALFHGLAFLALARLADVFRWRGKLAADSAVDFSLASTIVWFALLSGAVHLSGSPESLWELLAVVLLGMASVSLATRTAWLTRKTLSVGERDLQAVIVVAGCVLGPAALLLIWLYKFQTTNVLITLGLVAAYVAVGVLAVALVRWLAVSPASFYTGVLSTLTAATMCGLAMGWSVATFGPRFGPTVRAPLSPDSAVEHVILLTVDTLRADALSVYGAPQATPAFEALAADSVVFAHAVSPAPWTKPSVASIMTGVHPLVHGAIQPRDALPVQLEPLAVRFREAGYRTAAFVRNPYLAPGSGFERGFDRYHYFPSLPIGDSLGATIWRTTFSEELGKERSDLGVTERAMDHLAAHSDEALFLWVHLFDPHVPYTPTQPPPAGPAAFDDQIALRARRVRLDDQDKAAIERLYLAEVLQVDENLGRIIERLKRLGIYEDALIALTSDHGEEFWEHDGFEHGHSLHREVLRVPLMIKLPRSTRTERVDTSVSTTGLTPTLLGISRVPFEAGRFDVDPLIELGSSPPLPRPAHAIISTGLLYGPERISVVFDGFKFIRLMNGAEEELYDLTADPAERTSIADASPSRTAFAERLLADHERHVGIVRATLGLGASEMLPLDEETVERLRSLGYVR